MAMSPCDSIYKLRFHIAFADCNKYGRMSDDELNDLFGYYKSVILKDPARAIAVLIVPTLTSAKRQRGDRDERARIERKADAKSMDAFLCQLYMSQADSHGNDTKLRSYSMYVLASDDEQAEKKTIFDVLVFGEQTRHHGGCRVG